MDTSAASQPRERVPHGVGTAAVEMSPENLAHDEATADELLLRFVWLDKPMLAEKGTRMKAWGKVRARLHHAGCEDFPTARRVFGRFQSLQRVYQRCDHKQLSGPARKFLAQCEGLIRRDQEADYSETSASEYEDDTEDGEDHRQQARPGSKRERHRIESDREDDADEDGDVLSGTRPRPTKVVRMPPDEDETKPPAGDATSLANALEALKNLHEENLLMLQTRVTLVSKLWGSLAEQDK